MALRYSLIYGLILGVVSAGVLWSIIRQVDPALKADLERDLTALVHEHETGGVAHLTEALLAREKLASKEGRLYLLSAPGGEKLAGNLFDGPDEDDMPHDREVHTVWVDEEDLPRGAFDDDAYLPVIATRFPDGSRLLVGRGIEQSEDLFGFAEFMVESLGMSVLLGLIISVTLGRSILRRMDTISRTAGEIMAGDLSQRVPISKRNDEFDALAGRLNAMLDRVQQLIKGLREVTDNVAHDLRSPLTRLRNRLEITLLEHRGDEEYRDVISRGIEDAESLIKTFNALLSIAQTEAGTHRTQWGPVDLDQVAFDLVDLYGPLAEEKQQVFDFKPNGNLAIIGSRHLVAQVMGNLLENAIKYTPPHGTVRLQIHQSQTATEVIVSDSGPGIPAQERERVLERFVRLEGSRHTPGNGLGLSLVKAVCKLHGAELMLADNNPGLIVTIRFPRLVPN
ncbi:MAG: HAMP domain-containing sensor histidine kinase [Nevskiales bacterium]